MFLVKGYIKRLRKVSIWLFIIPFVALVFSIFFNNLLLDFKPISKVKNWGVLPVTINCDSTNIFCTRNNLAVRLPKVTKFEECYKFIVDVDFSIEGKIYSNSAYYKVFKTRFLRELSDIKATYYETKIKDDQCILNSKYYGIYKIFQKPFYIIEKLKSDKKYRSATGITVNPFIYGEVSISNLVKRFPINYFFKPLMFITSLFMIFYWLTYQKVFREITQKKITLKFTIFGVLSGIFLFFHILFLGSSIDNEVFQSIRKLILIIFILLEILAQFFLTKTLYLNSNNLNKYIYKNILNIKIIFISIILVSTFFIIIILSLFTLDSKIDYILEWNYFIFLLFFYLISFFLWKKS